METLTAADCDYLCEALMLRRVDITRVLAEGPLTTSEESQVAYINALFLRLRNLENDLNWANSPDGQVIRN